MSLHFNVLVTKMKEEWKECWLFLSLSLSLSHAVSVYLCLSPGDAITFIIYIYSTIDLNVSHVRTRMWWALIMAWSCNKASQSAHNIKKIFWNIYLKILNKYLKNIFFNIVYWLSLFSFSYVLIRFLCLRLERETAQARLWAKKNLWLRLNFTTCIFIFD